MTIKFDANDGIINNGRAALRPTVSTINGRHIVEKPRPVTPFTEDAKKYVPKIIIICSRL
jgi:hypothetical protein|tara:strand:+ start:1545 stop:1724 length:180 start_codon:yes stop_codon:yes gene_type:complete